MNWENETRLARRTFLRGAIGLIGYKLTETRIALAQATPEPTSTPITNDNKNSPFLLIIATSAPIILLMVGGISALVLLIKRGVEKT